VTFATQIQAVAVGWLIYQIKKDPLYLGLIGLTEAVPAIGLALLAGWIVDRGRPLRIYRRAVLFEALSACILWLVCANLLKIHTDLEVALIFFSAFLTGTARAFLAPSQFSILPLTVERSQLGQATAWNTSLNQIAALSGPALGGFLYALIGGAGTFFVIMLTLLLARMAAAAIRSGNERRAPDPEKPPLIEALLSGVRFVFASQIILGAMALDMFGVLFGGANALFPIFADLFSRGPIGLGMLRAAMPIGSFLMGWFLIRVSISRFSGKIMLLAFVGFGACMVGFGISGSFYLSLGLLVLTGMCDSISMVTRQTILQLSTPPEMRGRVASVSAIFIGSSNEIGAFESGIAAKFLGTRPSVVFGGLMTLLVVAITWVKAPKLRKVELSRL